MILKLFNVVVVVVAAAAAAHDCEENVGWQDDIGGDSNTGDVIAVHLTGFSFIIVNWIGKLIDEIKVFIWLYFYIFNLV